MGNNFIFTSLSSLLGRAADQTSTAGGSAPNESVESSGGVTEARQSANQKRGGDNIQLRGKNIFAVPRNVKPLGWTANALKTEEVDEQPKSNEEFRKLFIKK